MLKSVMSDVLKPVLNSVFGGDQMRWAYNFDGANDRASLASRAIDPDGDIDIEWEQRNYNSAVAGSQCIVTQCVGAGAAREFMLRVFNTEQVEFFLGGVAATASIGYGDGKWRAYLTSNSLKMFKNGAEVYSATFNRGANREPAAATVIGARLSGSYVEFIEGLIFNIKINGTLWKIDDYNQSTQPSLPAGNSMTLFNSTTDRWEQISN